MTYDDLQQAALAHRREHGKRSLAAIYAEFNADCLEDIPETEWSNLLRRLNAGKHAKGARAKIDTSAIYERFNRRNFDFG